MNSNKNNVNKNNKNNKDVNSNNMNKNNVNDGNIIIYTDGSCSNNIGGLGYVVIHNNNEYELFAKVPVAPCTNQIAELYAIYSAIYYVITKFNNFKDITIYTDSKYSMGCLTRWYPAWQKNGWINSKGESVANKELIQAIIQLSVRLKIKYFHVKAHNNHKYNDMADRLANDGRKL